SSRSLSSASPSSGSRASGGADPPDEHEPRTVPMTEAHPAEGAAATAPTCYRHPDRETYIRCSRCDKPICPECMVSAAVGFQCPDCVAEGRRTQRPVKTVFGGDVHRRADVVTISIIVTCVAAFALQVAYPAFTGMFWMRGV